MNQVYDVSGDICYLDSNNKVKSAPIKRAAIAVASSGDNTVIAAVSGKKIRVLGYVISTTGTVTIRFEDGAGGTALTGQMGAQSAVAIQSGFLPHGWFETSVGTLLNLELSAAISVAGHLIYIEVD